MNLILENSDSVEFYTYLDPIFEALPELKKYDYLISDLEINGCSDTRLHKETLTISGQALSEVTEKEKVQFIWGVFSAYEKAPLMIKELPYADGNRDFWRGIPTPQAKEALFEIVAWDSTCTLFIGISDELAARLKELYPDIKDLDIENKLRTNKSQ
jgi:hypothetical protein